MGSDQCIKLDMLGKEWVFSRSGNLENLWDEMIGDDPGDEDRIPYWAEIWPASIVLSEHIYESSDTIRGMTCLDVGCGLGLTSVVAQSLGADVLAMDSQWEALRYCRYNAFLNNKKVLKCVQMDWRNPGITAGIFDFIWAADVLYEVRFTHPLTRLFKMALKDSGKIWIADPQRNISERIWHIFQESGFKIRELKREKAGLGSHKATVRLIELTV
ncbi:MAG: methyltransferase [Desulfonatronovibrio sp.]